MGKKIKYDNDEFSLSITTYVNNSRLAVLLLDSNGEYCDSITINISDFFVAGKNSAFLNADINSNFVDCLKKENIICETIGSYPYNYGEYELVLFDMDVLKEYDAIGVEEYLKYAKEYSNISI